MKNENIGAWFNKDDWKDMRLIMNEDEQPPDGFVRAQPLPNATYQNYDEETGKWIADPNSEILEKIDTCKKELAEIDREAGAGRAVRGLAMAVAEINEITGVDYDALEALENRAVELRAAIAGLSGGLK
jgi:hypothetical protein